MKALFSSNQERACRTHVRRLHQTSHDEGELSVNNTCDKTPCVQEFEVGEHDQRRLRSERIKYSRDRNTKNTDSWKDFIISFTESNEKNISNCSDRATIRAYDLQDLVYARLFTSSLILKRTEAHLKSSDIGHWALILLHSGSMVLKSDRGTMRGEAGFLGLVSLASEFSFQTTKAKFSVVLISREEFAEHSDILDAGSNLPLEGTVSRILCEFIKLIDFKVRSLTYSELPLVTKSLKELLKTAVVTNQTKLSQNATQLAISTSLVERVRSHIRDNLHSPELSLGTLSEELNISKRKLHYLFEKHGGIANYIRQTRLLACHKALNNSGDHRLISSIAYEHGYTNIAQFTRHFRIMFGYTPSEVRKNMGVSGNVENPLEWIYRMVSPRVM
ncbi:helix-turn-helix domain-containing protein [Labrenzia sp. OB1]|uniref:helix-turn-helix domain-containing protein n=1 Tax=Labrenzia sp. OB1 TaxID=1561204 RepID=UPI0018FEF535|nr:helix-turn-helix domain-containing protein [Labrenzia sp. OB1]